MKRFEYKYGIDQVELDKVLNIIRLHPAGFKKAFPNRRINNIYLDTSSLNYFYQNIDGVPRRTKYRYRWYGDDITSDLLVRLEAKHKENELGWKDHIGLTIHDIESKEKLEKHFLKTQWSHARLSASIYNWYERYYFISADGLFRLTLDYNQHFGKAYYGSDFVKTLHNIPKLVLEVKFDSIHSERSDEITQGLPFIRTKNSKYSDGVVAIMG